MHAASVDVVMRPFLAVPLMLRASASLQAASVTPGV
jgi:hypothetical protein